ncbi:unnamed protein product [Rotaria sordida]|uniref:BRCT domain-containing protein n=1 Tax=Rotaria sordida TaxID=392033 RepID=A0A813Z7M9_9BILA|nr:unnamed protein product [Rotaria sordida]CAF1075165.1 unnamed protein product [Rotaria sordida]
MRPSMKRTIITSKTTGRRYFLVRSSNRGPARRYYVCSRPDCDSRLTREADFFCRVHSQVKNSENEDIGDISTKSDNVGEDDLNDNGEIVDEDNSNDNGEMVDEGTPIQMKQSTTLDSIDDHEQNGNGIHDSNVEYEYNDASNGFNTLSSRQRAKANREIHVDETTGIRSFRDSSGRRRYLCMRESCTNMLKRQADIFCRTHSNNRIDEDQHNKKKKGHHKRYSTSSLSNETQNRFRSPFSTTTTTLTSQTSTNEDHSEEYESPEKPPEAARTSRTVRDASGKIRFVCSIPLCTSQVPRKSQALCRRHLLEASAQELEKNTLSTTTNDTINPNHEDNSVPEIDVNHNNTVTSPQPTSIEHSIKKRKYEPQTSPSTTINRSVFPANKIVISTTTLLDHQWTTVLTFLRQFPQVQLATNLNVNNFTTHLLIDDSEKLLHCTITKKIVQASARRHIFIISSRWITECIHLNEIIDEHPFEITSDSHTTLRLSVQNFQNNHKYLFNNSSSTLIYGFAIECRQCQGSISRNELIELIELTGAKLYDNENSIDILIVLCDTNEKNLNKIKEKYCHINVPNIKYVICDFLLKSIVKFEIQDVDKYSL